MKSTYLKSVRFNAKGLPTHATVKTPHGIVKMEWRDVAGDWCAFAVGWRGDDTLKLGMVYAPLVERMAEELR